MGNKNYSLVKVFRILRVIRPLRIINRNEGLKLSIHTLFKALPGILNVILVSLLIYLIFGVIGINYFKGSYFYC